MKRIRANSLIGIEPSTFYLPQSELLSLQKKAEVSDHLNTSLQHQKNEQKQYDSAKNRNWMKNFDEIRKKNLQSKLQTFIKDEEIFQRQEEVEESYRQQQRKSLILKANNQFFSNQNRVREFDRKLLMVDVMHERQGQAQQKQQLQDLYKEREQGYKTMVQDGIENEKQVEQSKLKLLDGKKQELHLMWKHQHSRMKIKENHVKFYQDKIFQAELQNNIREQDRQKESQEKKVKKDKINQNTNEIRLGKEFNKLHEQKIKARDIEDDQKIQQYLQQKESLTIMQKARKDIAARQRSACQQRMVDIQVQKSDEIAKERQRLLAKSLEDAENNSIQKENLKKEKIKDLQNRCYRSHSMQAEARKDEIIDLKLDDKHFQDYWIKRNKEISQIDMNEIDGQRQRSKQLTQFHEKQIEQQKNNKIQQIHDRFRESEIREQGRENQDQIFTSWANQQIKKYQGEGKNVNLLVRELNVLLKK